MRLAAAEHSLTDLSMSMQVEEPTVRMTFLVNTSPFAGREGKFVTSRNIKERLERELERNLVRAGRGRSQVRPLLCCRVQLQQAQRQGSQPVPGSSVGS